MKNAMARLMLAASAVMAFMAVLPSVALAEAQPAKKVLLWGPINPDGRSDFTRISDAGLRLAYEELIPSAAYYAHKYPNGIQFDSVTSVGLPAVDLPASLDDYALVFVMFPYWDITSNQVAKLKTVTARGGRLVLIGEHGRWAPRENAVLTRLAKDMGTHFSITNGSDHGADQFNVDADLLKEPLATMPKSSQVAPLVYSGVAQEIARLKTSPYYVWAVDEASGNGRITVFSDINWCLAERYNDPLERASIPFLERLLSNAIECEQKVIDGEDPNQDIEEKVPDGMVAAVRDNNGYLTYYPTVASACDVAKKDGYTVVLKREVAESFVLPVGVTFDTSEVTTNYAGSVTAPSGYEVRINDAHTIYKVEAVATPEAPVVNATDGKYPDRVVVTWEEPESFLPVTGYEVRRVKVGSTLEVVLTNLVTGLTFTDYGAKSGVHYTYRVRARSDAGWGWFGEDVGWTGQGVLTIPLPVAVDVVEANGAKLCDLTISTTATGGGEVWYGQDEDTHDGIDAGRNGDVPDGGSSTMTTVVTNAGTVSFWWNVSSEPSDRLSFSVDGAVRAWISGTSHDWEQRSFIIGAGTHELAWTYAKDASGRAGQDAGWVDQISWKPLYEPGAPGVVNASDGTSTNRIDVTWTPSMSGGAADGYELSRSEKGSGEWDVLTNDFVGTAWTDLDVTPGVEYTYRVRARNVAGYGPYEDDDGWRRISLAVNPTVIAIAYTGGGTNISISTSTNWTVSAAENWVEATQNDELSATLTIHENKLLEERTNTVTVTAGDGSRAERATVMVVQGPRPPNMDVGFEMPYEDWRTRMQISTNTTADTYYAPVSVFVAGDPLDISFGWTNKSEVAVSMPPVRFRIFKPGNPDRIRVSEFTAAGRSGETLDPREGAWSGRWQNDVLKVLKPGDYLLEAEIDPANTLGDADRRDNKAVFRFAVRNPALEVGKDIFRPEDGWASVLCSAGNDFAQPPHVAVRIGSAGTNETAIQFGPYVPMNGKNGRTLTQSGKMPLDLVFLIDYTGSMGNCIGGLVNNIGAFIEQLIVGDSANGIEPLDDVRIKIVGFNDTENYSSKDWFVEGNFTSDVKELKNDLSRLRSTCGAGSGNAGENSFDALYYLCKGWKPTAPRTKDSPHAATSSPFRGTNEASRVVLLFTDEPPHMPFSKKRENYYWGYLGEYSTLQLGDDGYNQDEDYCFNLLDQALKDAAINLTIIGGNCYSYTGYPENDKRYDRLVNGTNGDPDHREYKKLSNLSAFSGDASLLRGLATNVASKVVATDAKIVEPALEAYVRGGGTLRFDWRNDSTAGTNNIFSFTVDGVTNIVFDGVATTLAGGTTIVTNYGGNGVAATWHRVAIPMDDGMHHFKWNYGKIDYDGAVSDCGIVSNIQWDPWKTELGILPSSVDVQWDGVPIAQTNDENTVVFDVACNSIWKVVGHSDWITVEQGAGNGDGNLVVSVATNLTYAERTGYVTVRAGEYGLPSDDILGKPEVTVYIVQEATPYDWDGNARILTVDVKPRWPWNSKVDIDFRVQTPWEEGTPVTVKFWGLNKEGGSLVDDYPTLKLLRECPAKNNVYEGFNEDADHQQPDVDDKDADGMVYLTCPTSGLYRLTWDMGKDWDDAAYYADTGLSSNYQIWKGSNMFHTPEFAVRLQVQAPVLDEEGDQVLDENDEPLFQTAMKESERTVRVDIRLASLYAINYGDEEETDDKDTWAPAGGRILTGWEKIGHPYGAVDPVPVDTRVQFQADGWTRLDSIDGLPIPEEFAAISNRACVINSPRVAIEGGVIATNTVWGVDKVHVVRDNVFVASNATLTIEANAIVKFCDCTRIFVHEFDNIVGEGGRHNIVVKGATFVHGYSHVGGDTLYSKEHDLSLKDGAGSAFAQPMGVETCENNVIAWPGESGAHIAVCGLELSYVAKNDPTDETESAFTEDFGQIRLYSYEQKLGNLQRPSREGCSFYGWYYKRPDFEDLGYTLVADNYESSKKYFIYPESIPFSLEDGKGLLSDSNDSRIYALFCAPDWVTEGLVREDASTGTILLSPETVEYNGTEQKPAVGEVWIGGLQIASANYEVDYGNGGYTNVGEYDVRVNFKVDYENSPVAKFRILPRSNKDATVAFSPASVMCNWDPEPNKPDVTVTLPGMASVPAKDYAVSWIDDNGRWPKPGKYAVVVSFNGNYTGPSITNDFEVVMNPKYLYEDHPTEEEACAQVESNPRTDDNSAARRILYIGCRQDDALSEYVKDLLANDIDLCSYLNENFVCWSDDIEAVGSKYRLYSEGLASDIPPILAIVSANDTNRALASHSGYITREELVDFLETAKTLKEDASSATLELSSTRLDYTGGELKPSVTVRYAGAVIPGDNYELEWSGSCTNSGVYEVKAVFNGIEYVGETGPAEFEIVPVALTASMVALIPSEATYDGETHWPEVAEVEGVVFDVDYGAGDYTNVGTNTVKVTATGNYHGTVTKSFAVVPRPVSAVIELDSVRAEFTEDKPPKSEVKPVVIAVKEAKQRRVYVEGVDYDLDWGDGDYMAPTNYTITAVFKGNYTGRATATFVIALIPPAPSPGVSLPSLPGDATDAQVRDQIATISWKDPNVAASITNVAAYAKFRSWVESLDDATREKLADSSRTYISSVVSEILASPYLLGDTEKMELSITEFKASEPVSGKYEATIELKVGDPLLSLKLSEVKAAFADKIRMGTSLDGMAPAQESDISAAKSSGDKVVLTVVMPKGESGFIMMKIE